MIPEDEGYSHSEIMEMETIGSLCGISEKDNERIMEALRVGNGLGAKDLKSVLRVLCTLNASLKQHREALKAAHRAIIELTDTLAPIMRRDGKIQEAEGFEELARVFRIQAGAL